MSLSQTVLAASDTKSAEQTRLAAPGLTIEIMSAASIGTTAPDDNEIAAALVAIMHYLAGEQSTAISNQQPAAGWQTSKIMLNLGLHPINRPARPSWSNLDRLQRNGAGFNGIVGI